MKITKNASGKKVASLTQKDWEDFGKKAGWLNSEGKLIVSAEKPIVSAENIEKEADIERTAQPVTAPPRPKTPPSKSPTEKPIRRRRRRVSPLVNPKPKAKEVEESPKDEFETPTIASELKRLLK
jgi:hypothetical protein